MDAPLIPLAIFVVLGGLVALLDWLHSRKSIRDAIREADIQRQIDSLRRGADHAVQTRPRVRAHSIRVPSMPPRSCGNAESSSPPLKPCGGGFCRHRADCADHYCPGRMAAGLSGATPPRQTQSRS